MREPGSEDDAALWQRTQRGDNQARDLLIARNEGFLRRWARRIGRRAGIRPDDLDEAEQESLCAVFCAVAAHRYAPVDENGDVPAGQRRASFRSYSATIARNRVLNLARGKRRYERRICASLDALPEDKLLTSVPYESCPHTSSLPHLVAQDANGESLPCDFADENLAAAVRGLKRKESRLLTVWLQGRTDADAAQCLGLSPTAVKLPRQRIFKKLREILDGK